jgi:heme exporter protein A
MPSMIETHDVVKSFGPHVALAGVDLSVEAGEFVALMGPNGAGKTTLLRILATLARPTSGTVRIAGLDPSQAGEQVRRQIGFLSHRTLLYDDLSAEQNLRFYAQLYDLETSADRIEALLKQVGLAGRRHDLVRTFSRGMQQRLSVARAVLHQPGILLLDEPYTGLDPDAAQVLTDLLGELAEEGTTVLLTTHNLERALAAGRRVVVLSRGRLVYDQPWTSIEPDTFFSTYRELTA